MRKLATTLLAAAVLAAGGTGAVYAQEKLKDVSWPQSGFFGTYDQAALQRGFQIYQNVCQNCHSLKYLAFRNLERSRSTTTAPSTRCIGPTRRCGSCTRGSP
jgi:ubiquinol-cytochrome c reductase cytochrome c1 subunit